MIETTYTVKTIDGRTIELNEGSEQIWGIRLQFSPMDRGGRVHFGQTYLDQGKIFHCTREPLERAGLLSPPEGTEVREPETVEDLVLRLLEMLGVSFEE